MNENNTYEFVMLNMLQQILDELKKLNEQRVVTTTNNINITKEISNSEDFFKKLKDITNIQYGRK